MKSCAPLNALRTTAALPSSACHPSRTGPVSRVALHAGLPATASIPINPNATEVLGEKALRCGKQHCCNEKNRSGELQEQ
jgi:hypothetical protein